MTFGFDSAVACVADALDRLHTTAISHKRVMVIEVMGRQAGWIALCGGIAGGLISSFCRKSRSNGRKIVNAVRQRDPDGYKSTLIVVAEGAKPLRGHYACGRAKPGQPMTRPAESFYFWSGYCMRGAPLVGEPLSAKPATRPRASAARCAGSSNLMHASLTDSVAGWKRLPSVRANSSYLR